MPECSTATMLSAVPYVPSAVTWWGRIFHRKAVQKSRSSMGRFSETSPGVTSTERMMRALPPSTT